MVCSRVSAMDKNGIWGHEHQSTFALSFHFCPPTAPAHLTQPPQTTRRHPTYIWSVHHRPCAELSPINDRDMSQRFRCCSTVGVYCPRSPSSGQRNRSGTCASSRQTCGMPLPWTPGAFIEHSSSARLLPHRAIPFTTNRGLRTPAHQRTLRASCTASG